MSDVIERLRLQAEYGLIGVPDGHNVVSYGEAADEIERLSARLAECERERDGVRRVATLRAMVIRDYRARAERLEAALRECSGVIDSFGNADDGHVSPVVWRLHDAEGAVSRARAALKEEKP